MIRILIACGSGIATSTMAAEEVAEVCKNRHIYDYIIKKCSLSELKTLESEYDLILTTNTFQGEDAKNYISVINFVTGVGEEDLKKRLGDELERLQNSEKERRDD